MTAESTATPKWIMPTVGELIYRPLWVENADKIRLQLPGVRILKHLNGRNYVRVHSIEPVNGVSIFKTGVGWVMKDSKIGIVCFLEKLPTENTGAIRVVRVCSKSLIATPVDMSCKDVLAAYNLSEITTRNWWYFHLADNELRGMTVDAFTE